MRRTAVLSTAIAAVLALAVAACGGGYSSSPTTSSQATTTAPATTSAPDGTGTTTLELQADPGGALAFDKTTLEASAGQVTIEMTNPSSTPHNVALQGNGVDETGAVVANGGVSTVTADLAPGTYRYFCSVDAHAEAGMEGTLTVK